MTYKPTMAEAQAMGLCYLARQPGLPDVNIIRMAVAHLHPLSCGWCEYPLPELIQILKAFNERRDSEDRDDAIRYAERDWWAKSNRGRREAIKHAQGNAE